MLLRSFEEELELRRAFAESLAPRELAPKAASAFIVEIRSILGTSPEPLVKLPTIGTFRLKDYQPLFEPSNLLHKKLSVDTLSELDEFQRLSDWNRKFLSEWRIDESRFERVSSPASGFELLNDASLIYLSRYFADTKDRGFFELEIQALELAMCIDIHNALGFGLGVKLESIGTLEKSKFSVSQELEKLTHVRKADTRLRAAGNRG